MEWEKSNITFLSLIIVFLGLLLTGASYIGNGPYDAILMTEATNNPSASSLTTGSDVQDKVQMFMRNDKICFAYNRNGIVNYACLPLDGGTTAWSNGTTNP